METILLTGAGRGIGLALARQLAHEGFRVLAGTRQKNSALAELQAQFPERVQPLILDVTSPDSVAEAAGQVGEGTIDAIINNAGVQPGRRDDRIADIPLTQFTQAFEVNVVGALRIVQQFLPNLLLSQNPRIMNFSSGMGSISDKKAADYYVYGTSKAALNMATRTLALELERVTVVAISPGWVRTDMGGSTAQLSPEECAESVVTTLANLRTSDSGKFLDRHGKTGNYQW